MGQKPATMFLCMARGGATKRGRRGAGGFFFPPPPPRSPAASLLLFADHALYGAIPQPTKPSASQSIETAD